MKKNPHWSKDSLYQVVRGEQQKSCPACSRREGRPVFYPVADYGERTTKGRTMPQSYCNACRTAVSKKDGAA